MTLPDWLEPLPDAAAMRATDAWAIEEQAIPGPVLMERAGAALRAALGDPGGAVTVVCGTGNNGGDGFVLARLLREEGAEVRVLLVGERERVGGDARVALDRLGPKVPEPFGADRLEGLVVDCLLGTGTSGPPRDAHAAAIAALEGHPVLACDVPSGVDASTGEVPGAAVHAQRTVTFHAAKPGLWIAPGKAHAGEVEVVDIGIPAGAPVEVRAGLVGPAVLREHRPRDAAATKFASGHVLVCGGARGMSGAVTLATQAAMRAGAGYVTVAVPEALEAVLETKVTESMTLGLPADGGAALVLDRLAQRGGVLVLGPGAGREDAAVARIRELAAGAPVPLVLDADGLNAHAGRLEDLAARGAPTVLTPHAGELARLLGREAGGRLEDAREAARRARAVVVLKGDDTLVVRPDGTAAVGRGDSPGLATAGTGDVLAGTVGAFLARGTEPFAAAAGAVLVHAEAGRMAAADVGVDGVVAGDVVWRLGIALTRLRDA